MFDGAANVRVGLVASGAALALCAACSEAFTSGSGGAGGSADATTSSSSTTSSDGGSTTSTITGSGGHGPAGGGPGGSGSGGGGTVPPPCAAGWDFYPPNVTVGGTFDVVYFTDQTGSWTWVKFTVTGNGNPQATDPAVIGNTPPYVGYHAWEATVSGHLAGQLDLAFWENCDTTCSLVSTCSIMVEPATQ